MKGGLPLKPDEVGQGADCEIKHDVHSPSVHGVDEMDPVIESSPVGVDYAEVEGGIAW